jgi:hypothetical protein
MSKLWKNKKGIIWVWIVFFMSLLVLTIVWLPLSYAAVVVIDTFTEAYDYPPEIMVTINMLTWVGTYSVLIMLFGLIGWAIKSSINPQEVSYPR